MKKSAGILILLLGGFLSFLFAAQTTNQEIPISPRLSALRKDLESGNPSALESFWQEVSKQGAPLVEPIAGESGYVWLTFLWRAREETKNVVIWSDLGDWQNLA